MKLCFLVLLMAALGKSSVFDNGLEDNERAFCSGTGTTCGDPCGSGGTGICFEPECCPTSCMDGLTRKICVRNSVCLYDNCWNGDCCTACTDDNSCNGKCTECDPDTQSCNCLDPSEGGAPKACGCIETCSSTTCTFANGKCGTGVGAKTCLGSTTCQCSKGDCVCGPCDNAQCAADCKALKDGDTGTCGATGCTCSTPPPPPPTTTPCTTIGCQTALTFNIDTCGAVNGVPCP